MERLEGHINHYFFDRKVDARRSLDIVQELPQAQRFVFKEEEKEESLQDTIPFLKMLQSEEDPWPFFSIKVPWELDSYPQFHSPVQSDYHNSISALSSQEHSFNQATKILPSSSIRKRKANHLLFPPEMTRGKRKRRKTKPSKNIEDIENHRMNHIAIERNRRRQMNEHIISLRSLLPPNYIQRGDQASIVGGAINYVKYLEQIIKSLQSQKRTQGKITNNNYLLSSVHLDETCIPRIEARVIQRHVNLKVQCRKRQGQPIKVITSLEKLGLTVLHLNISSLSNSVSYSFNLKMEEHCGLDSADDVTKVAHEIFEISDDLVNA